MAYQGGLSPRTEVGHQIYTASDEPGNWCVELHSEMTYLNTIPDVVTTFEILSLLYSERPNISKSEEIWWKKQFQEHNTVTNPPLRCW